MLVMSINFNSAFQRLHCTAFDAETGETLRVDDFHFDKNKVIRCRTIFEASPNTYHFLAQFSVGQSDHYWFHLMMNMIRGMDQPYEECLFDPREAADWLIETGDWLRNMSQKDLIDGLFATKCTNYLVGGGSIRTSWTMDTTHFEAIVDPTLMHSENCFLPCVQTIQ